MNSLISMRLEFNRYLLDAIGSSVLNSSIFAWDGGLTKWMLAFCMAIAFFQSVLKSEKTMLVEWTKIIIASWFCLAILGGVDATKQPPFGAMNSALTKDYKIKSGKATLDRIVFNYMSMKFDSLGNAIMNKNADGSGGYDLSKEVDSLNNIQDKFIYALSECTNTQDVVCMKKYLTASDPAAVKEKEAADAKAKGAEGSSSWFGAVPGAETAALIASFFAKMYLMLQFPVLFVFPIALFFLKMATAFVNFFVLLAFGITAAMSLFMLKVLCVFMVIPSYRDRVIKMFKVGLSASMYGFAMNLMLWISYVITKALNEATGNIVIDKLTNSAVGKGEFALVIGQVIISNFLVSFVILVMQIVAMTKVPKFTRNLMDLSLEELVNIGDTLFTAGLGVAKLAGGLAMGVGGLAAGMGGGLAAGLAKTQAGGAVSNLGSSMSGKFRGMMGWNPADGPGDFGGSGGGGSSPQGGGSGGGGSMFTPNPSRGGTSDLTNIAMGEANLKATTTRNADTILAEKADDDSKSGEERIAKLAGGGSSGAGRALTVTEQKAKREADMKAGWSKFKSVGGAVGGTLIDMAIDGAMAGAGSGDGLGTVKGMMGTVGKNTDNIQSAAFEQTNNAATWAGSAFRKTDLEERATNAEEVYRSAVVGGKTNMSGSDNEILTQNLAAINSGSASNEQMRQVLEAQNTKNLSKEQKESIDRSRKTSKTFGSMMADQEESNKAFLKNLSDEFTKTGGQLSNKTMQELAQRTSAGLMDYEQVSNQAVWEGIDSGKQFSTLGKELGNISKQDIENALKPMTDKLDAGGSLSIAEQQQARRMYDNNKDAIVGNKNILEGFDKTLGGTVNTEGLRKSREDSTTVVEGIIQSIKDSGNKLNAEIMPGMEMSLATKNQKGRTTKTGGIDGFYMGDQAITSNNDFKKLSPDDQKRFNEMYDYLKMAVEDKETNNMMKERMANLRLNSDNIAQIYEQMKKIKNG